MWEEMCEEKTPLRFRYMLPMYGYAKECIQQKHGQECKCIRMDASVPLGNLFYEQLDLLAGVSFWKFFEQQLQSYSDRERMEYMERCSMVQLGIWWEQILLQYPVLKRLVIQWITDFTMHVITLYQRLEKDMDDIVRMLGKEPGLICMVDSGDSDIHEGQCVHIITFENGMKIVYKPRSLKLDQIWQDYLQDMAIAGGMDAFKTPWILQREGYGYEEYIERKPVSKESGFLKYFRRCGFLLGVSYALQGNDFHAENLIACGDCPVLVDLETGVRACGNTVFSDVKNPVGQRYQFDSVLRTNLLPFLTMGRTIAPGDDAFTARKESLKNLPYDGNGARSAKKYVKELIEGFCLAYDTVQKYGVTRDFSGCSVRVLIRNTSFYRNMQKMLYAPEYMKDSGCFEHKLDYLAQLYQTVGVDTDSAFFGGLLKKEKQAVRDGYIPRITLDMQDCWNGEKTISLAQLLVEKPAHMDAKDKARQCQRIWISLNTGLNADSLYVKCFRQWKTETVSFRQIGDIMRSRTDYWKRKLASGETVEGIVVCRQNGRYYLTMLPWNMMEGIPGLLPAMAAWYRMSGDRQALDLFLKIAEKLYIQLEKTDLKLYKPGMSEGLEGILCMALLVRRICDTEWIGQIYDLISPYADADLYRMDTRDENVLDARFRQGLRRGMEGVDFPSFFKGEGGWLYQMLRNAAGKEIPPVAFDSREQ